MSRRSSPRQSKQTQRAADELQRLVAAEVSRRLSQAALPPGAVQRPINDALLSAMQANQQPGATKDTMFAPGAPIVPIPGLAPQNMPRQFQFPVGYNIAQLPRNTEATSFDTLRNLAALYDGYMLCEQVWLDTVSKLSLKVVPRPELVKEDPEAETHYASDISRLTDALSMPDPGQGLDTKAWLRMGVREQLQIDALAIYPRRTRGGGLYSLEIVDGTTIKPLLDERGRRPAPPFPAYQQFVYGAPGGLFTSDDLLYVRETPRAESVYGLSRIERIILRVNQALRKQNKDLTYFTDGNVPSGLLSPPDDDATWTPEQLVLYQEMWDSLLAGNDQAKSRIKVIPPGAVYTKTDADDIMTDFDRFLLNVTVACMSMTMADLGFTESVNKSSGDSQENVFYRRAVQPLMDRYAALFTLILRNYFQETRFVVTFGGFEESEDFASAAAAYVALVGAGIISPSNAARQLKLPVEGDTPPFVLTKDGPVFLEDAADPTLRKAQMAAKVAGAQMAQNPPTPPAQQGQGNATKQPAKPGEPPDNVASSKPNDKKGDDEATTKRGATAVPFALNSGTPPTRPSSHWRHNYLSPSSTTAQDN